MQKGTAHQQVVEDSEKSESTPRIAPSTIPSGSRKAGGEGKTRVLPRIKPASPPPVDDSTRSLAAAALVAALDVPVPFDAEVRHVRAIRADSQVILTLVHSLQGYV